MVKRTRHRVKTRPKPPIDDRDETQLELAELAVLWPRLDAALGRDSGAPSEGGSGGGSTGDIYSAAAVNMDVMQARAGIESGVLAIVGEVVSLLNLKREPRQVDKILEAMPEWYRQLRDRRHPLAGEITRDASRWLTSARTALRLRTVEEPIGWRCPHHRDKPAKLVRDADEARLHASILNGQPVPRLEAPLTWRRAESVHCPRCKQRWSGVAQLRALMRMIEQADSEQKGGNGMTQCPGVIEYWVTRKSQPDLAPVLRRAFCTLGEGHEERHTTAVITGDDDGTIRSELRLGWPADVRYCEAGPFDESRPA